MSRRPAPACAAESDRIIGDVSGSFQAQLIASAEAEQPTLPDRLRCARVALRQAMAQTDITEARGWIETALRQIGGGGSSGRCERAPREGRTL